MAALQNFIDNNLPTIKAAWLNTVDAFINTLFNGATTPSGALEALGVSVQPTFRNRFFNGNAQVGQFTNTITGTGYIVDGWQFGSGSPASSYSVTRVQAVGLANFPRFIRFTSNAANAVGTASYWLTSVRLEAIDTDDFNFGTTNASNIVVSFWARASVNGTYCISLRNSGATRSYVTTITVTDNLWKRYSLLVPGDTTGTWNAVSTGVGIEFSLCYGSGATVFQTGTPNVWTSGNFISTTAQTNLPATNGATFDITGLQIEKGGTLTEFEHLPHQINLARAQRYYEQVSYYAVGYAAVASVITASNIGERVVKRASPAISSIQTIQSVGLASVSFGYFGIGPGHVQVQSTGAPITWVYQAILAVDARL